MYFNIKHCRCQLQLYQNIDKKLVYQILKSPAIEMIAGLNFNIQMIYLSKKCREKCRDSIELYCNVMKFNNSKIA
ncbi:FanG protein [Streptococcus suis]|nr:FanG protein [Streptococcus suis]